MTDHHPQTTATPPAPTARQQRYLRQLALARGVSFVPPRTCFQASRLIDQLKQRAPETPGDRRRELRAVQDDLARGGGDAARVRDEEIAGYGSNRPGEGGPPRAPGAAAPP